MNYKKQYLKYKQKYLMSQMGGSDETSVRKQLLDILNEEDLNVILNDNSTNIDVETFSKLQKAYQDVSNILIELPEFTGRFFQEYKNILVDIEILTVQLPAQITTDYLEARPTKATAQLEQIKQLNIADLNNLLTQMNKDFNLQFKIYNELPTEFNNNQILLDTVGYIYSVNLNNIKLYCEKPEAPQVPLVPQQQSLEVTLKDVKSFIQTEFTQFQNQADDKENYRLIELKNNDFIKALCPGAGYVDGKSTYSHILVALITTKKPK